MLDAVQKGFKAARNRLRGQAEITPDVVEEAVRDIRVALLEADVEFGVVKKFVATLRQKAVGEVVQTRAEGKKGTLRASPADHFIKICHDELEALMGPVDTSLKFRAKGPTAIMMVGLQGSGKTTTAAKLAGKLLKEGKKPLLVAADIYRPAAVEQLKALGERLGVPVYHDPAARPPQMCKRAMEEAKAHHCDVVIMDTAGRLAIDDEMMAELEQIKAGVEPDDVLLVADAIGQDAVKTSAEFNRRIGIDGFILTKLDGDARGGAALSIKEVTGKPIKFLGTGEGLDKLEEFRPEGLASRILGFGDIVGLMKDFEQVVDEKKAEEDAAKILSGNFTLQDFVDQIRLVKKMGSLGDLLEKFPLFGDLPEGVTFDDKELSKIEAMVDSMTPGERQKPDVFNGSRVSRVAKGSGRTDKDVRDLLARYQGMRGVMKQIGDQPGLLGRLPGFRQLAQLRQMKGMDLGDVFEGMGLDGGKQAMLEAPRPAGLPKGYTPPMDAATRARARAMGYALPGSGAGPSFISDEDKKKLKDRRKRERQARKKNRKRNK